MLTYAFLIIGILLLLLGVFLYWRHQKLNGVLLAVIALVVIGWCVVYLRNLAA